MPIAVQNNSSLFNYAKTNSTLLVDVLLHHDIKMPKILFNRLASLYVEYYVEKLSLHAYYTDQNSKMYKSLAEMVKTLEDVGIAWMYFLHRKDLSLG